MFDRLKISLVLVLVSLSNFVSSFHQATHTMKSSSALPSTLTNSSSPQIKVAVIGAGAAGLVTSRILLKNGIQPTILEKDEEIGGVWNYKKNSKSRPMYRGLRTNLPRELMAYREFPWGGDGHSQSFVTHLEVKQYLQDYAKKFGVSDLIHFNSPVQHLKVLTEKQSSINQSWPKIQLEWTDTGGDEESKSEVFDAVCVCNGHYAAPFSPKIQGMEYFKGEQMHSIEYDDPSIFRGKTVLCVGGRASGADLAREISLHSDKVYLADTTCPELEEGKPIEEGNVAWVPRFDSVNEDGTLSFAGGCMEKPEVDIIVFCSGYDYQFPFISDKSNMDLSVVKGERRVSPLYEQLWHARYPSLTFVGLQHSVVPFPFFELQAEAIVSQFDMEDENSKDKWTLPSLEERLKCAQEDAEGGGPNKTRVQDTHFLGSYQWDECLKYATFAGLKNEALENYITTNKMIYDHSGQQRKALFPGGPDTYRYNSYIRKDDSASFEVMPVKEEMKV